MPMPLVTCDYVTRPKQLGVPVDNVNTAVAQCLLQQTS